MSEFLLIVPEGWTEVPFEWIEGRMGFDSAQQTALQEMWWEFENALEESGNLPAYPVPPTAQDIANAIIPLLPEGVTPEQLAQAVWNYTQ